MFPSVLSKEQTHAFIECVCLNESDNLKKIECELIEATNWQGVIYIVTYFVAIVLERKKKDGKDVVKIIDTLHSLPDTMFLSLLELDGDFIGFMLRHVNPETENIDSAVVELYQRWVEHDYSRDLRL
jgi:hypothetical protein